MLYILQIALQFIGCKNSTESLRYVKSLIEGPLIQQMFLHPNWIIPCLVQTNLRGEVKRDSNKQSFISSAGDCPKIPNWSKESVAFIINPGKVYHSSLDFEQCQLYWSDIIENAASVD